jgi:hypothetical protein
MSLVLKRRLAVPIAVLAFCGGSAGPALACHGDGTAAATLSFTTAHHDGLRHGTWLGTAATTYLGLTPTQIKTDLTAGKTLAQIANASRASRRAGWWPRSSHR